MPVLMGAGGWGHIMYHIYPTYAEVETFTGKEDYQPLLDSWNKKGEDPKSLQGNFQEQGTYLLWLKALQLSTKSWVWGNCFN